MHLYSLQRILVCTDFSESSDVALQVAEQLRKRGQGTIHLLHVSELGLHLNNVLNSGHNYRDVILGDFKKSLEEKLNQQIRSCKAEATAIIKEGNIVEVVHNLAEDGLFDLIVMGHGRSPLLSQIIGSTAYKMISSTPLPLLLVKKPLTFGRVAGLIDESRTKDKIIIGTFDFFQKFKFNEVSFISLWIDFPGPFGNQQQASEMRDKTVEEIAYFKPDHISPEIQIQPTRELKLASPLNQILQETHVDVAVLKKFTEGNLKRVYLGSTTKKLLEIFNGNLLVLPPSAVND